MPTPTNVPTRLVDFTRVDLWMTIIVASLGALVMWLTNNVLASWYGPYVGLALSLVVFYWVGYYFAVMPTRWWGHIVVAAAILGGFLYSTKATLRLSQNEALLITLVATTPLLWGFCKAVRRFNLDQGQQKIARLIEEVAKTITSSLICSVVMGIVAVIPYAWPITGAFMAFMLGKILGSVTLPAWQRWVIATTSVLSFGLGLKWHLGSAASALTVTIIATSACAVIFFLSFLYSRRRTKDDKIGEDDDELPLM